MREIPLRADCTRCAALCCVTLPFDRSPYFAFDKLAATPCPNLTRAHRCSIHDSLADRGFAGCARYECWGAGQRVTQEVFGGRSWREEPHLAEAMFEAFRVMREVHELLVLLEAAKELPLTTAQERTRQTLEWALEGGERGWSLPALRSFERSSCAADIEAFLASLREVAAARQPARRHLPLV